MKLVFSDPRLDGPLKTPWDALLRIVGTFALAVNGRRWYEEQDFCLLEFANSIVQWLEKADETSCDFVYSSLESAESELIRFERVGTRGWRLRSPHESYREEKIFSIDEIRLTATEYLKELRRQLPWRQRVLALLIENEDYQQLAKSLS